jgi:hypothetical protein
MKTAYSDEEAKEAWLFVNKFGPSNAWTGTGGTAARIIGRLLVERDRLLSELDKTKKSGEEDGHIC